MIHPRSPAVLVKINLMEDQLDFAMAAVIFLPRDENGSVRNIH